MKILIIDNGSRSLHDLLQSLRTHTIETVPYTDFDFTSPDTAAVELIILPGASQYEIDTDQSRFEKETHFIRNTNVPMLGICFGAELLAHAYKGQLQILPEKVDGVREIAVLNPDHPLCRGHERLQVLESHRFAIKTTPPPLTPIANSVFGVEIFEHTEKPLLGMQFHPESLRHTADGPWLLNSAIDYLRR
jgi:GMP synthase (glutamine-hydrolysing)